MKKLITIIVALTLLFVLFACTTTQPYDTESEPYEPTAEIDPWYGSYPEGFTPRASLTNGLEIFHYSPEGLVERTNLLLTGTVISAHFEWQYLGSEDWDLSRLYEPMIVYTIAVAEILQTNIEVGETIEVRARTNYRDVILSSNIPAELNIGEKYLLALLTFENMAGDERFANHPRALMPMTINSRQWAYSLETNLPVNTIAASAEGIIGTVEQDLNDETVFTASEILALFE